MKSILFLFFKKYANFKLEVPLCFCFKSSEICRTCSILYSQVGLKIRRGLEELCTMYF